MSGKIDFSLRRPLIRSAFNFAMQSHFGQKRKYTGDDYIVHPIAVANIVTTVPHTDEMIAAALLHDVVEDCGVKHSQINLKFGREVAALVFWLTDASIGLPANRATRKKLDMAVISMAPPAAKTIKLADILDNEGSIRENDPNFWVVFQKEKIELLNVLSGGNEELFERAKAQYSK